MFEFTFILTAIGIGILFFRRVKKGGLNGGFWSVIAFFSTILPPFFMVFLLYRFAQNKYWAKGDLGYVVLFGPSLICVIVAYFFLKRVIRNRSKTMDEGILDNDVQLNETGK